MKMIKIEYTAYNAYFLPVAGELELDFDDAILAAHVALMQLIDSDHEEIKVSHCGELKLYWGNDLQTWITVFGDKDIFKI